MKQAVSVTMVIGALLLVASSLQGCGCDKDAVTKCATDNPYSSSGSDPCTGWDKLMDCIEDAKCCDYEEGGNKLKEQNEALYAAGGSAMSSCKKPC